MVAAQRWNERSGHPKPSLYGAVTSGSLWQFLKLEQNTITVDLTEYTVPPVEQVLGILVQALQK
jgi:hypothetical protein